MLSLTLRHVCELTNQRDTRWELRRRGLKETAVETDPFRAELDSVRKQMCFLSISTYKAILVVTKKYSYETENMQAVSPLNYFIFYRKSVFLSKKKQTDCVDLNRISSHLKF